MGIKTYRPITPSLRFKTTLTNEELTTDKPHKPLTRIKVRTGGRARLSPGERRPWPHGHPGRPGHSCIPMEEA